MEVTLLDADDNRYDPEIRDLGRGTNRWLLVVQHSTSVDFSRGDRAQLILVSDTYQETDPMEMLKKREVMKTVVATCTTKFSEETYCWGIGNESAVNEILAAENNPLFSDFT